ncbi:Oidioi.mRNA.OKI2018_I69.chr2.g4875.t1.cds [Oikopleura dioica]|uniref:Oidioi.mRNA.OKI2018_I69.chr2.g4875.t1.cds n=1 Tax=Oikopleura dioica TaxID=34765 RepID=A0ABN7T2Z5_OIKDI|nr:Oidioi.mRNA.OKI2018_I69.chr2.g4875.t1.cds [Oikopleura dioica]
MSGDECAGEWKTSRSRKDKKKDENSLASDVVSSSTMTTKRGPDTNMKVLPKPPKSVNEKNIQPVKSRVLMESNVSSRHDSGSDNKDRQVPHKLSGGENKPVVRNPDKGETISSVLKRACADSQSPMRFDPDSPDYHRKFPPVASSIKGPSTTQRASDNMRVPQKVSSSKDAKPLKKKPSRSIAKSKKPSTIDSVDNKRCPQMPPRSKDGKVTKNKPRELADSASSRPLKTVSAGTTTAAASSTTRVSEKKKTHGAVSSVLIPKKKKTVAKNELIKLPPKKVSSNELPVYSNFPTVKESMKRVEMADKLQEKIDEAELDRTTKNKLFKKPKSKGSGSVASRAFSRVKSFGETVSATVSGAFKKKERKVAALADDGEIMDEIIYGPDIAPVDKTMKRRRNESSNASKRVVHKKERLKTPAPLRKNELSSSGQSVSSGSKRSPHSMKTSTSGQQPVGKVRDGQLSSSGQSVSSGSKRSPHSTKTSTRGQPPVAKARDGQLSSSGQSVSSGSKRSLNSTKTSTSGKSSIGKVRDSTTTTPAPSRKKKRNCIAVQSKKDSSVGQKPVDRLPPIIHHADISELLISSESEESVAPQNEDTDDLQGEDDEVFHQDVLDRHRTQRADYFEARRAVETELAEPSKKTCEFVKLPPVPCYNLKAMKWREFIAGKFSDITMYLSSPPQIIRFYSDGSKLMNFILREHDGYRLFAVKQVYFDHDDDIYYLILRCKRDKVYDVTKASRPFSPDGNYDPKSTWTENVHYISKDQKTISEWKFVESQNLLNADESKKKCDKTYKFAILDDSIVYQKSKNNTSLTIYQERTKEIGGLLYAIPRRRVTKPHCCKPLNEDNDMRPAVMGVMSDLAKMHYTVDVYREVETLCDTFNFNPPNGMRDFVTQIRNKIQYRNQKNWKTKSTVCPSVHLEHMKISFRSSPARVMKEVTVFDEEKHKEYLLGCFRHHVAIYWNEDCQVISADGTFKSAGLYTQYYLISLDFWVSDEKCASILCWHGYSNQRDEIFYERVFDKLFTDVKACGKKIGRVKLKIDMELAAKNGFKLAAAKHGVCVNSPVLSCNYHSWCNLRRFVSGHSGRKRLSNYHYKTMNHLMACKFVHPGIVINLIHKIGEHARFSWRNKLAITGKKKKNDDQSYYFPDGKTKSVDDFVDEIVEYWTLMFSGETLESYSWYNEVEKDKNFVVGFDMTTNSNEAKHSSINRMHMRYVVKRAKTITPYIENNSRWLKEHFTETSCGKFTYRNETTEELNSVNTIYCLVEWSKKIAMREDKTITPGDFDRFVSILRDLTIVKDVGGSLEEFVVPPPSLGNLFKPDATINPIPMEEFECFGPEDSVDTSQFAELIDEELINSVSHSVNDDAEIDLGPGFQEKLASSIANDRMTANSAADDFNPDVPSTSEKINDLFIPAVSAAKKKTRTSKTQITNSAVVSHDHIDDVPAISATKKLTCSQKSPETVPESTCVASSSSSTTFLSPLSRQMSEFSLASPDPYSSLVDAPIILARSVENDDSQLSKACSSIGASKTLAEECPTQDEICTDEHAAPVSSPMRMDSVLSHPFSDSPIEDVHPLGDDSERSYDSDSEGSLRDFIDQDEAVESDRSYNGNSGDECGESEYESDEYFEDGDEYDDSNHGEGDEYANDAELNERHESHDPIESNNRNNEGDSDAEREEMPDSYRDSEVYDSDESDYEDYPPRKSVAVVVSDSSDEQLQDDAGSNKRHECNDSTQANNLSDEGDNHSEGDEILGGYRDSEVYVSGESDYEDDSPRKSDAVSDSSDEPLQYDGQSFATDDDYEEYVYDYKSGEQSLSDDE